MSSLEDVLMQPVLEVAPQLLGMAIRTEMGGEPVVIRLNEVERTMVFTTSEAYIAARAGSHYPAPGIALKAIGY